MRTIAALDVRPRLAVLVATVTALIVPLVVVAAPPATATVTPVCPTTQAVWKTKPLTICGSEQQIYIANATPNGLVHVSGPSSYVLDTAVDELGGLVVRDVPVGTGYTVSVGSPSSVTPGVDPTRTVNVTDPTVPDTSIFSSSVNPIAATDQSRGYFRTRDGTWLSYYLRLPAGGCSATNPCDVLMTSSGYSPGLGFVGESDTTKVWNQTASAMFTAVTPQRYAVIGVNERGSGCSGGSFDLMEQIVREDGYDAIEILAAQPWVKHHGSRADIALVDKSWPGLSQLFIASTHPPDLAAIAPGHAIDDFYHDVAYPGGVLNSGFGLGWAAGRDGSNAYPSAANPSVNPATEILSDPTNPLYDPMCAANQVLRGQNVNTVQSWIDHPTYDSYWTERTVAPSSINVPTLLVAAWQDPQTGSHDAKIIDQIANGKGRLIGSNGGHDTYWSQEVFTRILHFLDVNINGLTDDVPKATIFMEAADAPASNVGSPPVSVPNGSMAPRGAFTMSTFATPTHSYALGTDLHAASSGSSTTFRAESQPFGWLNANGETATFTSDPLSAMQVMAGSGSVSLSMTSSGDADLQVVLSEIRSDGQELYVQSGWKRATGLSATTPTTVSVELFPFAHAFHSGSRIRITVSAVDGPNDSPFVWGFKPITTSPSVTITHAGSAALLPNVNAPSWLPGQTLPDTPPACGSLADQFCRTTRTITVTTATDGADAVPSDGVCEVTSGAHDCSLRAAIQTANAGTAGSTAIVLAAAGPYTLTHSGNGEDAAATGDLDVSKPIVIEGRGAVIDGNGTALPGISGGDRIFDVQNGGSLSINDATLQHGSAWGTGGAIQTRSGSSLSLHGVTIQNSDAAFGGGGIYVAVGTKSASLSQSVLTSNRSSSGGGILAKAGVSVRYSIMIGDSAWVDGGAIEADAPSSIAGSWLAGNTADGKGGAIAVQGTTGTVFVSSSTLATNHAGNSSGTGSALYTIRPVTFAWSTAKGDGTTPNTIVASGNTVSLLGSIIEGGATACSGPMATQGFNIDHGNSCGLVVGGVTPDQINTDPMVDAFGTTAAGSPAVDAGPRVGCPIDALLATSRPQGPRCDIGATEQG